MKRWAVLRTDTSHNVFLVEDDLSEDDAYTLAERMTRRGHHQFYEALPYDPKRRSEFLQEKEVRL